MGSISEIVSLIVSIVGVFGGGTLLFWRQNKQAKVLENQGTDISNTQKLIDEWQDLYNKAEEKADKWEAKVDELREKVDKLQDEITEHRNVKAMLREENGQLKVEVERLKPWKCEVKNCSKRRPPSPATMDGGEEK